MSATAISFVLNRGICFHCKFFFKDFVYFLPVNPSFMKRAIFT